MSKKQQIIDSVKEAGLTEDLQNALLERIATMADEPSQEELQAFDAELASLQLTELEVGQAAEEMADEMEAYVQKMDTALDEYTQTSVQAMYDGLNQADDIAATVA